jgi:hypothetical protein
VSEKDVKDKIKKLLDSFAPDVWYFMPYMSGMGRAGIPDIIICCRGLFIAVEVKADPKKKTTVLQDRELAAIRAADGEASVVHSESIQELSAMLHAILAKEYP